MLIVLTVICPALATVLAPLRTWALAGPLLLFLGLLTLLNAPFDWASLGLTRALLRRGLELGGLWPYALALVDALAAAGIIAILSLVCVLGVQAFDDLAEFSGGERAIVLPLADLFNGIATDPAAPEFWWVYLLLLSTMIPSLINLTIGGFALLRGIPWLTARLLRAMPAHATPPPLDRIWLAPLLTVQPFVGGLLGIVAQALLAYVGIGLLLPILGLDLLELARWAAAPDLPGQAIRWFTAAAGG